jgi:hypothetical protein
MNKHYGIVALHFAIAVLSTLIAMAAHAGVIKEIRLDKLNTLVVRQEDEHTVSVEILYTERRNLVQRFTSGNGLIEADDIRAVNLGGSSKDPQYLVTIHVWGSNYGAMIGIIVYRLIWWEFLIIPDDRFFLTDIDGDGILEIQCERLQKKTYDFVRGVLKERATANKSLKRDAAKDRRAP